MKKQEILDRVRDPPKTYFSDAFEYNANKIMTFLDLPKLKKRNSLLNLNSNSWQNTIKCLK